MNILFIINIATQYKSINLIPVIWQEMKKEIARYLLDKFADIRQ